MAERTELLDQPGEVREEERLDPERLRSFQERAFPGPVGPVTDQQFRRGHSNLTYLVRLGDREAVLRRAPRGANIKTAHDMRREFTILSALEKVYPKVPRPIAFCEDEGVIGARFYLMERVQGVILRGNAAPPGVELGPDLMRRLSTALVDGLAALHAIDVRIESDELRAALEQAGARVAEAEAEARLAEVTLARRERLAAEGVPSAHDLDQARSDLEAARARIATWRAESARMAAQLAKARVVAPLSGVVTLRSVDRGETVEAGQALFVMADLSRLRVEAEADEADASVLALGAPATITAQGWTGQSWNGRVEEVADSVTPRRLKPQDPSRPTDTRVLAVKVAFTEKTPLKLGATVELRIRHQ